MNLHDHSFLQTIAERAACILEKSGPNGPPISEEKELYVITSLIAAEELASQVDQLAYAELWLSGYRRSRMTRPGFPSRVDYIAYHLENHHIRTVALYERALMLTNVVFQLGLPERACSKQTVAKNNHVDGSRVSTALAYLEEAVRPSRERRNLIVHRRAYLDPELSEAKKFFVLEAVDLNKGEVSPTVRRYRPTYKRLTDAYVRERKDELKALNQTLGECASDLFDALEPEFAIRCEVVVAG